MTEREWLKCRDPDNLLNYHSMKHDRRRLRLLAAACVRHMWVGVADLLPDPAFYQLIEVVERYADGAADRAEFIAARKPFRKAVRDLPNKLPRHTRTAVSVLNCLKDDAMEGMTAAIANARFVTRAIGKDGGPVQCDLLRDVFGNPHRPVQPEPSWLRWNGAAIVQLAQAAYEERTSHLGTLAAGRLGILADALEDAGCTDAQILEHCRGPGPHVKGCFIIDLILGKG